MSTEKLLKERGNRYGDFAGLAEAVECMEEKLVELKGYESANPAHREAAHMIIQKLCRAFNGDPHYQDNWADIAGYAKLAQKACRPAE